MVSGHIGFYSCIALYGASNTAELLDRTKTQQHILLSQATGTVWQGNAEVESAGDGSQNHIALGHFAWQVYPLQILQGRLYLSLSQNDKEPIWLSILSDSVHIEHFNIDLPAAVISQWMPSLNAAQLGGKVQINSDGFILSDHFLQGKASVDWQQVNSPLSTVNPLGHFQLELEGQSDGLKLHLSTISGPLQLEGNGLWSSQSGLSFDGEASADTNQRVALAPILHVLGNEQSLGSGRYKIVISH